MVSTDERTVGQPESSIPPTTLFRGGKGVNKNILHLFKTLKHELALPRTRELSLNQAILAKAG
jgi:hypothetical protein